MLALNRNSFLTSDDFSQAIQVHPVYENASSMPSFKFDLMLPRRPPGSQQPKHKDNKAAPLAQVALVKVSPRAQRLQRAPGGDKSQIQRLEASEVRERSTNLGAGLSPDSSTLFDALSRTLCVEPDQNTAFFQPSNRIATNYTPTAGLLMMQTVAMANGNVSKSAVAGLMFYEQAFRPAADTPTGLRNNQPRVVQAGVLWTSPESPPRRMGTRQHQAPPASTASGEPVDGSGGSLSPAHAQAHDAKSEERYFEYINEDNQLVEHRWLSPISQELIDRIVSSAVKYLVEPPSGHMLRILDSAQQEFVANYYVSAKKAILDYLLLREQSRVRLGITCGTPRHAALPSHWEWGASDGNNGCLGDLKFLVARQQQASAIPVTASAATTTAKEKKQQRTAQHSARMTTPEGDAKARRRQRVKSKLSTLYMLSDPILRALQSVWHEVEPNLLLVKFPSVEALSSSTALLDLHAFESEQLRHAAGVKAYLMEIWYGRARTVVEDAVRTELGSANYFPSVAVEQRIRHLFDAIGTLMALQLRSLVAKSVKAYVAFFELFGDASSSEDAVPAEDDQSPVTAEREEPPQHRRPQYSGLLLSLVLQDNEVQVRLSALLLELLSNVRLLIALCCAR